MRTSKKLGFLIAICSISVAMMAAAQSASAGTLYRSTTCVPTTSANMCEFSDSYYSNFGNANVNSYCRFGMVDQNSWYPSHRVKLYGRTTDWFWHEYQGSWTSARFAYSPIGLEGIFGGCSAEMNTSTSLGKAYNNQLYIGTY